MYVVQSGEVELKVRGGSLEVVGPDGFFGERALPDQGKRTATTDCTIIPIAKDITFFWFRKRLFLR
jgi:CRP/FNR family transcriptional regulator, cyclic AMP receptor protein